MNSSPYASLLERTRLPQPSFQRLAVVSLFEKLRSAPRPLGVASAAGRDAVAHCLRSPAAAVADQAARELCRLAVGGLLPHSDALVELQSALEGIAGEDPRFAAVFVKGIGFLCRVAFRNDPAWGRRFDPVELHPFVKVLSCQAEVQYELIQQVLLFITHNKSVGMEDVSRFLRPFLMFSAIWKTSLAYSSSFATDLISSIASLSCSFPSEAVGLLKLLVECLKCFPRNNPEEFKCLIASAEYLVDAFVVVLKHVVHTEMLTNTQMCSLELLEFLLALCTDPRKPQGGTEIVFELSKRLLVVQKDLGLCYLPEFRLVTISISIILTLVEFEHEHLAILKLLIFLVEWKHESGCNIRRTPFYLFEELLWTFPVINLLSSPSNSVKTAATYLLSRVDRFLLNLSISTENAPISDPGIPSISTPEAILFRLLHHLWFQEQSSLPDSFFTGFMSSSVLEVQETYTKSNCWISKLREYLSTCKRQKPTLLAQSPENQLAGMSLLLSSIASSLVVHPALCIPAVDSLAAIGAIDAKLGMPLLLAILFYNKMLSNKESSLPEMSLKLLELLPSLASHFTMVPVIMQTILPMLHKDAKPVLYAAAVRLLCKTWIVTDRAFGALQGVLDPKAFSDYISEREICISIAASVRDVCRHNPDRGVDLILSVSSSIECQDPVVQALGFESLAHLCEADVIEFYTAWNVISKHMFDYSADPLIAYGLCTLLRWGAMDAEAYPDASNVILQILWEVGTRRSSNIESLWVKARAAAFKSLSYFEAAYVQEAISDFKKRNLHCLVSEDNVEVLKAMEDFEVKIIKFEHITRRRVFKEKRVMVHKVEKMLNIFPRAIFSLGEWKPSEIPGAALLSLEFTPKDSIGHMSKDLLKVHAAYEKSLLEIAESLHVSRNIFVALLALQSWKPFVQRWMRAVIMLSDGKGSSEVLDNSSKSANHLLKVMCKAAVESIPRVAVNIAFAVGALCMVLPPSAHLVISSASNFLLKWLFEYEHEHQQWSAAISLGQITNSFHATDRKPKSDVITALIEVLFKSKSLLVKGACGVGLGFACQNLLTRVETADDFGFEEAIRLSETTLLQNIINALSLMICQLCPSTSDSFKSLSDSLTLGGCGASTSTSPLENCSNLEEDAWGVAGLVMGLGNSVVALYRFGAYDALLKIKDMLISWIPCVDSPVHHSLIYDEVAEIPLFVGSCLVLPTVVAFCQRAELMDNDLDVLFNRYASLISELLSLKKSGILYQNLLMASCIGAGTFLSCIMNDGLHAMRFDDVKHFLEILRSTYTHQYPPLVHLGGMIGVVNALGAGAGYLTQMHSQPMTLQINYEQDRSLIRGPILSNRACESLSVSMVQEMFLVAKGSKDRQVQKYAAWAVSFLRHHLLSKDFQNMNASESSSIDFNPSSQNFGDDSLVWKLSLWLRDTTCKKTGDLAHASTVATILRCLLKAPRLPALDWGAIIRCCMRYEAQLSVKMHTGQASLLREECINFSLAHANAVGPLLHFLDELTDLSRFRTLELNLQCVLLCHLSNLSKLFSGLRLEKLYSDLVEYFTSSVSSYLTYGPEQKSLLRVSFWKGLHHCLTETSEKSVDVSNMEKGMECLFSLLPMLTDDVNPEEKTACSMEWSEAIKCLDKAQQDWLVHLLQVPVTGLSYEVSHPIEAARWISAKARLVRIGRIPISELRKLKVYILNARTEGTWWNVLVEVAAAVFTAEVGTKRQWLLDALEISCITDYPSTALRFVGLLSGSCCIYMPFLMIDPVTVLSDLPVTLWSLLSDSRWNSIAGSVADLLWSSTERICSWASWLANGDSFPSQNQISESEADLSVFLARLMHRTCMLMMDYLPPEKRLRLANLELP